MNELKEQLKALIIETLALEDVAVEDIVNDEPLFDEGLGLDSIDALELGLAIKKTFNVKIEANSEETQKHFFSVTSLAEFISSSRV